MEAVMTRKSFVLVEKMDLSSTIFPAAFFKVGQSWNENPFPEQKAERICLENYF